MEMVWTRLANEQEKTPLYSTKMDTTWEAETREANGHLEKDCGVGDERGWQDLERAELACPRQRWMEETCRRLMFQWEPRGLSE